MTPEPGEMKQMRAVAQQVADFAYKQGVGEAVAVDHVLADHARLLHENERLRELLAWALPYVPEPLPSMTGGEFATRYGEAVVAAAQRTAGKIEP